VNTYFYFQIAATLIFASIGQILFKYTSILLNRDYEVLSISVIGSVFLAFLSLGLGSIIWIILLRNIELSRAYPFISLSFILVPLLGFAIFNEQLSLPYFIGTMFILVGVMIIAKYGY
jgi:drug/metabolite transporter (DMT)-like permease